MTFSLSSREFRQIFQCHLYLLTCFTAISFFQYDVYSSGLSSFSPERTLKKHASFYNRCSSRYYQYKRHLLISEFFATIVFSQRSF